MGLALDPVNVPLANVGLFPLPGRHTWLSLKLAIVIGVLRSVAGVVAGVVSNVL